MSIDKNVYEEFGPDNVSRAADILRDGMRERGFDPDRNKDGVILGSGLGSFAKNLLGSEVLNGPSSPLVLPYADVFRQLEIEGPDTGKLKGHAKKLVVNEIPGSSSLVIAQAGREHLYEGVHPWRATFWLRVMQELGVKSVVGSNASGIVTPGLLTPEKDLMLVMADVDATGVSPFFGPNDESFGPRFPHRAFAYPLANQEIALKKASELGISLKRGVYFREHGPEYETREQVYLMREELEAIVRRALAQPGDDRYAEFALSGQVPGVVGMSSTYEAKVIEHAMQQVRAAFRDGYLYISVPTNYSASLGPSGIVAPSNHGEVDEVAVAMEEEVQSLVHGVLIEVDAKRIAA